MLHHDSRSYCGIQALCLSKPRYGYPMFNIPAYLGRNPVGFTAYHKKQWKFRFVIAQICSFQKATRRIASGQKDIEIGIDKGTSGKTSHGGTQYFGIVKVGTVARKENLVDSKPVCCPDDCTEISGIRNSVKTKCEGCLKIQVSMGKSFYFRLHDNARWSFK